MLFDAPAPEFGAGAFYKTGTKSGTEDVDE